MLDQLKNPQTEDLYKKLYAVKNEIESVHLKQLFEADPFVH